MKFDSVLKTDVGRKRSHNEDNGASRPEIGLFLVADGMGGHQGGERASMLAAETIPEHIAHLKEQKLALSRADLIRKSIEYANSQIHKVGQDNPDLMGMGTTVVAAYCSDGKLTIGHVGDSRCYYVQPGAIWQLTRDHSLVQEKLQAGIISREQAKNDTMKNVITRSVGFEPKLQVEVFEKNLSVGDVFLLCSDGLSGELEDKEILHIFDQHYFTGDFSAEKTVAQLIEAANANGGEDNITALVFRVVEL